MRAVHNPMTTEPPPRLTTRILLGAIAGFVATAAMTAAMARLHRRLPEADRYPLPPREITQRIMGGRDDALVPAKGPPSRMPGSRVMIDPASPTLALAERRSFSSGS